MKISNIKKLFTAEFWSEDETKKPASYRVNIERHSDYLMVTTPQLIRTWVLGRLTGKTNQDFLTAIYELDNIKRERDQKKSVEYNPTPETVQVYFLALILDGKVVEVMRASEKLADILVSKPDFVVFSPSMQNVQAGMLYVDGEFIHEEHEHNGETPS